MIQASRHGTFLSHSTVDSESIMMKLNSLINAEIECLEGSPADDTERRDILTKIKCDLSENAISDVIKQKGSKKFTISHQELHWLDRHDQAQWVEYMVYRYRFKIYPEEHKLLPFPVYVLIEPTSVCNLRCEMCFQADKTFTQKEYMGMMPWDLFVNVVNQAKENGCKAITLASRGEPTLHKRFCDMLRYIADKGFLDLKINTNAVLLNDAMCHGILSAGVNEVVFSVDAATKELYEEIRVKGNFDDVVTNITRFKKIRDRDYPLSTAQTRISGIKIRDDQDLDEIKEFWLKHVDQVVMKTSIPRWETYNNPLSGVNKPCIQLWERMYVWYDGTVNPCDIDYKSTLDVGNAYKTSLKEIWNSKAYNTLRAGHLHHKRNELSPCNRCNV